MPPPPINPPTDPPPPIHDTFFRRGYGFANHVTGYDMNLDGQEGFSVIKYGSEDQYLSHCDGDCTGSEFKTGGRIATMVRGDKSKEWRVEGATISGNLFFFRGVGGGGKGAPRSRKIVFFVFCADRQALFL